jgi:hypothetical protein
VLADVGFVIQTLSSAFAKKEKQMQRQQRELFKKSKMNLICKTPFFCIYLFYYCFFQFFLVYHTNGLIIKSFDALSWRLEQKITHDSYKSPLKKEMRT